MNHSVPQALEYSIGAVSNFFKKNLRRYSHMNVYSGVNETGYKLFTSVAETSVKFIAGVGRRRTV